MIKYTIGLPITKTKYLNETIESILNQSFKNYQVIFKNNGFDTKTKIKIKNICKPYLSLKNFKYLESKDPLDMSSNFNHILNNTNTEFFTVLSDDDILNPFFLEKIDNLNLKYKNIDLFHCRVKIIDEYDSLTSITPICPEFESQFDFIYNRLIGVRHQFLSDFIVRTTKLKKIGGFELKSGWGLDDMAWFKLSTSGVAFTNYFGLNYRSSTLNISYKINDFSQRVMDIISLTNLAKSELSKAKLINQELDQSIIDNAVKKFRNRSIEYLLMKKYISAGLFNLIWIYFSQNKKLNITFSNFFKAIFMSKKIKL